MSKMLLGALALVALPAVAHGQALECHIPGSLSDLGAPRSFGEEPVRQTPTTGYSLTVSWSPEYCHDRAHADEFQCNGRGGRFGFVLHGLWPDGPGRTWPQYCRPADPIPEAVIRQNLCTTPSVGLLNHEWSKHGTCMSATPAEYFDRSRAMYQALRFPDMATLSSVRGLTVKQFAHAFAAANRGISADMLRVNVKNSGWLEEVSICIDRAFRYTRCRVPNEGADLRKIVRIARPV